MLLLPEFQEVKLMSPQRKFSDHHHDLVDRYGVYVSRVTTDMFHLSQSQCGPSWLITGNTTAATLEQELLAFQPDF